MDPKELRNLMEAYSEVYAPQEEIGEAITSEKGKAKAAEMIAKRTTPSGRAKSGQGASVAQIKHISRTNVDGYGGTPPNLKVAKNPVKSNFTGLNTGKGNKAARRAGTYQEELDIFDVVLEFLQAEGYAETLEEAEWMMANIIDEEAIDIILGEASKNDERIRSNIAAFSKRKSVEYTPPSNWDASANRGKGATVSPKQAEKRRRKELAKGATNEEFEAWLDEAMSNYEKNRKRAAQRASARNAARDAGQTGAVKGVGYVTPRRERETYTDEKGRTRHAKGL